MSANSQVDVAFASSSEPVAVNSLVPVRSLELRLQKRLLTNKPASEFDNFYTPQNEFFYSKSPYLALDGKRREIRLLRVFPRKSYSDHIEAKPQWRLDAVTVSNALSSYGSFGLSNLHSPLIACELVDKVALSRIDGGYYVLSYRAGEPTDTKLILVDGLPFNAFANLEHAIECVLQCWTQRNPKKELLLWADQVCINQRDHLERSSQVGMMRDIYRRSNETFICLSTTGLGNCLSWVPISHKNGDSQEAISASKLEENIRGTLFPSSPLWPVHNESHTDPIEILLKSLQAFTASPWWHRAWVYQEFVASPWPTFLSGCLAVPWTNLAPPVDFFCSGIKKLLDSMIADCEENARREEEIERVEEAKRRAEEERERSRQFENQVREKAAYEAQLRAYELDVAREQAREQAAYETQLNAHELQKAREQAAYEVRLHAYELEQQQFCRQRKEEWEQKWKEQEANKVEYRRRKQALRQMLNQEAAALKAEKNDTNPLNISSRLKLHTQERRLETLLGALQHDVPRRVAELEQEVPGRRAEPRPRKQTTSRLHQSREESVLNSMWTELCGVKPEMSKLKDLWSNKVPSDPKLFQTSHIPPIRPQLPPQRPPITDYRAGQYQRSWGLPRPVLPRLQPLPVLPPKTNNGAGQSLRSKEWREKKIYITDLQTRLGELDLSTISSVMKGKLDARRCSDLKSHLRYSRSCDASDPRDKVYAFVGMAHKGYAINPIYTTENTVVHVLINAARRIVEYEKSLAILEHVVRGREHLGCFLPTWVPDWTSTEIDPALEKYVSLHHGERGRRAFNASKDLRTAAEFRADESNEANLDMKVKGVLVGILDELEVSVRDFVDLQSFLLPDGQRIIAPRSTLLDDEVWVLYGASKPVVLRPEDDDAYGFLGEALVYEEDGNLSEIMFGQMIESAEQGTTETREIWLV